MYNKCPICPILRKKKCRAILNIWYWYVLEESHIYCIYLYYKAFNNVHLVLLLLFNSAL